MLFRASRKVIAIALCLLIAGSTAAQQQPKPPYLDTSLAMDQRVADLVSRMTLDSTPNDVPRWGCVTPLPIKTKKGWLQYFEQQRHA